MDPDKNEVLYSKSGVKEEDEKLLKPFNYIFQACKEKAGPRTLAAFNFWFKIPSEKMQILSNIVQMVYNNIVLLDDLVDNSILRSGVPVAHSIYGKALSINTTHYVSYIILTSILSLNHPKKLLKPLNYIFQTGKEKIGPRTLAALNFWFKIPSEKLQILSNIVQMVYNNIVLLDDLEDNSILRNEIPVAHSIYGEAHTINTSHYASYIILERILSLNHPEAIQVYIEQLLKLHRGMGLEIYWRDNFICPSEEEYKSMVSKKTQGYTGLICRLMQLFSDCKKDFEPLAEIFSLYYQIRDDYGNLALQTYTKDRGYCDDISEGKFSFPIIHAILNHPEDNKVQTILRQRPKKLEVKKYCVNLLEQYGSFEYTRNALSTLDKKIRKEIERLGGNPYFISLMDNLLDWKKCS